MPRPRARGRSGAKGKAADAPGAGGSAADAAAAAAPAAAEAQAAAAPASALTKQMQRQVARAAANDPKLKALTWFFASRAAAREGLAALADALRGNTHLRRIRLDEGSARKAKGALTLEMLREVLLPAVRGACAVERVDLSTLGMAPLKNCKGRCPGGAGRMVAGDNVWLDDLECFICRKCGHPQVAHGAASDFAAWQRLRVQLYLACVLRPVRADDPECRELNLSLENVMSGTVVGAVRDSELAGASSLEIHNYGPGSDGLWQEDMTEIADALRGNTNCRRFLLTDNGRLGWPNAPGSADGADDAEATKEPMIRALETSAVHVIDLKGTSFSKEFDLVCELIANIRMRECEDDETVTGFHLQDMGLDDRHMPRVAAALPRLPKLRMLDLRDNEQITGAGVALLLPKLGPSGVTKIDLQNTACPQGMWTAAAGLCLPNLLRLVDTDPKMKMLEMASYGLADQHLPAIARALSKSKTVQNMALHGNPSLTVDAVRLTLVPALHQSALWSLSTDLDLPGETLAEIQSLFVPRLVKELKANNPRVSDIPVSETWLCGFGDAEAEVLSAALSGNSSVKWLGCVDAWDDALGGLTDAGALSLSFAIENSGLHCFMWPTDADNLSVSPEIRATIAGHCFENALRCIAANDESTTELILESRTAFVFTEHAVARLCEALHGNVHLREIHCMNNLTLTDRLARRLIAAFPHCCVESLDTECDMDLADATWPGEERIEVVSNEVLNEILEATDDNIQKNSQARAMLRARPYQRLCLAAIYQHAGGLALSLDLAESVAEQLKRSSTTPFTHAGMQTKPSHSQVFAWHAGSEAAAGDGGGGGAAAAADNGGRGRKQSQHPTEASSKAKRQKR